MYWVAPAICDCGKSKINSQSLVTSPITSTAGLHGHPSESLSEMTLHLSHFHREIPWPWLFSLPACSRTHRYHPTHPRHLHSKLRTWLDLSVVLIGSHTMDWKRGRRLRVWQPFFFHEGSRLLHVESISHLQIDAVFGHHGHSK